MGAEMQSLSYSPVIPSDVSAGISCSVMRNAITVEHYQRCMQGNLAATERPQPLYCNTGVTGGSIAPT